MFLNICLYLLVLSNFLLLGTARVVQMTKYTALQGFLLAILLFHFGHTVLTVAVLFIKGLVLPGLLWRTLKKMPSEALICPHRLVAIDVIAGMAGLAFAIWLDGRLGSDLTHNLFPELFLPLGLTTLFCGLILIIGRVKAITQVIGYLAAENGIFLLGMPLMTQGTTWFELALLLDVFVAVFVMGIAINRISDSFASMDVDHFRSLRD